MGIKLLFFGLNVILSLSLLNVRLVKIINIKGIPVRCKIHFNGQIIAPGNSDGDVLFPDDCSITDRFDIEPVDTQTYDGIKDLFCASVKDRIIIYSHKEKALALKNSKLVENIPDESFRVLNSSKKVEMFGKAALAANEIYNLDIYSKKTRENARKEVINLTAQALNVQEAIYLEKDKIVPSENLIKAVTKFQQKNGLMVTKKIDGTTLRHLAKTSSFSVMIDDFEEESRVLLR